MVIQRGEDSAWEQSELRNVSSRLYVLPSRVNRQPPWANLSSNKRITNVGQRKDIIDPNMWKVKPGVVNE